MLFNTMLTFLWWIACLLAPFFLSTLTDFTSGSESKAGPDLKHWRRYCSLVFTFSTAISASFYRKFMPICVVNHWFLFHSRAIEPERELPPLRRLTAAIRLNNISRRPAAGGPDASSDGGGRKKPLMVRAQALIPRLSPRQLTDIVAQYPTVGEEKEEGSEGGVGCCGIHQSPEDGPLHLLVQPATCERGFAGEGLIFTKVGDYQSVL
jgi:hypothetical protein